MCHACSNRDARALASMVSLETNECLCSMSSTLIADTSDHVYRSTYDGVHRKRDLLLSPKDYQSLTKLLPHWLFSLTLEVC